MNRCDRLLVFNTWGDALEAVRKFGGVFNSYQYTPQASSDSWAGATYHEMLKLAETGWPEAEQKIKQLSEALFSKVSMLVEKQVVTYDVEGIGFDIARVLDNEPESWVRFDSVIEEGAGHKVVRIVVNGFVSSGVTQDVIIARGAAIVALVEVLEYAGVRCEIIRHTPFGDTRRNRSAMEIRTTLKLAEQPVDLGRLAFALAHPASFRRFDFAIFEQDKEALAKSPNHGNADYELTQEEHQGDIYLGSASYGHSQWTTPERAESWVIERLKEQGVHLIETA